MKLCEDHQMVCFDKYHLSDIPVEFPIEESECIECLEYLNAKRLLGVQNEIERQCFFMNVMLSSVEAHLKERVTGFLLSKN